jgi:ribose transport system permease protein
VKRVGPFFQTYGVLVALVVLIVAASVLEGETFLSAINLRNIVNQNAAVGIIAVGMTVVIMTGGIDLSVGSAVALAAAVGIKVLNGQIGGGAPEGTAVAIAIGTILTCGMAIGALNGVLVTFGRVAPFIATLGGLVAFRSLTKVVAEGGQITAQGQAFENLGQMGIPIPGTSTPAGQPVEITWGIGLFVVVALVVGFLLRRTAYGRHVVAVGANERAALYSGINPRTVRLWAYGLMGLCVGLAAVVQGVRFNAVAPQQTGIFYELYAIAAVVIGGTSLSGGKGRVWGTVVGVMILAVITNLLILMNVPSEWQDFVQGVIILVAVLIQRGQSQRA